MCHSNSGYYRITDGYPLMVVFRSTGVVLANLIIEGCHLSGTDAKGIVEVAECKGHRAKASVELHHLQFTDNQLNQTSALYVKGLKCSLRLKEIQFRNNSCKGACFAHLSGSSTLRRLTMIDNRLIGEVPEDDALIVIGANSSADIKAVESRDNSMTALRLHEASVTVKNSTFASHSGSPALHLIRGGTEISGCRFEDNVAPSGAAVYLQKAKAVLDSVACTGNKARISGGCLFSNHSTFVIRASKIANNRGIDGGGIHSESSTLVVSGTGISSNAASGRGAAIHVKGGQSSIDHATFRQNEALIHGGGLFCEESHLTVVHSSFRENVAGVSGGAIAANSSGNGNVMLAGSHFWHNRAKEFAGALELNNVPGVVHECSIEDNTAKRGGAININRAYLELVNTSVTANKATTKGGGINAVSDSEVYILYSKLDSNKAQTDGGAIYALDSRVTFRNSTVSGNQSKERGGGLLVVSGTMFHMTGSKVDGNVARNGGGAFVQSTRVHLEETTFLRCQAQKFGGGLYLSQTRDVTLLNTSLLKNDAFSGGGLFHFSSMAMTFTGGRIYGNKAEMLGGGLACKEYYRCVWQLAHLDVSHNIAAFGGGVYANKDSTIEIHQTQFFKNKAGENGGAVHTNDARTLKITHSRFFQNSGKEGGAVVMFKTPTHISDCQFKGNLANTTGAAIDAWDNATVTLERVHISASQAQYGGAIRLRLAPLLAHKLTIEGSNLTGDGGGILATQGSSVMCSACIFRGNVAGRGAAVAIRVHRKLKSSRFQFIDSKFQNNSAHVGGMGDVFVG